MSHKKPADKHNADAKKPAEQSSGAKSAKGQKQSGSPVTQAFENKGKKK